MEWFLNDRSHGSFPAAGERRDRGAPEAVRGRISWSASRCAEHADRAAYVGIVPEGEKIWPFRTRLRLDRGLVRRLGMHDRAAHRELVDMLDWAETRGFDVRASEDEPVSMHMIFGSFSIEGVRRDRGKAEDTIGGISWSVQTMGFPPPGAPIGIRSIISLEGEDEVYGEGGYAGKFEADLDFVGRLAECGGDARGVLIERMGWNAPDGNLDVRPAEEGGRWLLKSAG